MPLKGFLYSLTGKTAFNNADEVDGDTFNVSLGELRQVLGMKANPANDDFTINIEFKELDDDSKLADKST